MSGPFLISGGGSGGHALPAAALANELERRKIGNILITDHRGTRFLPKSQPHTVQRPIALSPLEVRFGGRYRRARNWLWLLPQIYRQLKQIKAVGVVCFGGHFSTPFVLAAKLRGVPLILHEQNVIVGASNRVLSYLASAKTAASPCRGWAGDVVVVGMPSAADKIAKASRPPARPFRLTALGGSQAAIPVTETVLAALARLPLAKRRNLSFNLQCRAEGLKAAKARCRELAIDATVKPFFEKLSKLLRQSHLLISRAGAGALNDAALAACPVIALPYPYAARQHQQENAARLKRVGGGWVIEDGEDKKLAELILRILKDPKKAENKGKKIRALARPGGSRPLADLVTALARPWPNAAGAA